MSNNIIQYLSKTKVSKKGNINAILFSKETLTYYYIYNVNLKKENCMVMNEPINVYRPFCELFHVYFDELGDLIGEYEIVDGLSFDTPHQEVYEKLKEEEKRLLKLNY